MRAALEPVTTYFRGSELNVNTVLAAYLRSNGVAPTGEIWKVAKRALKSGMDFAAAARLSAVGAGEPIRALAISADAEASDAAPVRGGLTWFPKPFGPGDIDGVGAKRLLGTPNISPAEVLVRETAQNSWDARGDAHEIDYVVNFRQLSRQDLETLRTRVLTGPGIGTGIEVALRRDSLWALEISDRGTVGLGGPIRNDIAVPLGEPTDFIDLILNIGAPRDVHLGGGTYGFGKTITYSISKVGTVLFWTRSQAPKGLEERVIGVAIGDGFDMDGLRYTGQHWWGNVVDDRVEPIIGESANSLAHQVFQSRFARGETGTSLLILDPQIGGVDAQENIQRLREAIVWHLWPKLLPDPGRARMNIHLQLNGTQVGLPDLNTHAMLSGYAACLRSVRAVQAGDDPADLNEAYPATVTEICSLRPVKLLGHLALVRYPAPSTAEKYAEVDAPSHHVSLMRNQAELVVKYSPLKQLDVDGFQWAGVFKPVAETDDSFASAEPPAHDDWQPAGIQSRQMKTDVNVALKRIKDAADGFVTPRSPTSPAGPAISAAAVGDMLAGLLGGIQGPAPIPGWPRPGGGKRVARPAVKIIETDQVLRPEGNWIRTTLTLGVEKASAAGAEVSVNVRVAVDGGSEDSERRTVIDSGSTEGVEYIRVLGWDGAAHSGREPLHFAPAERHVFAFDARSDIAVDVETVVVNAQ